MNKLKSLSDSSTSESEDDYGKHPSRTFIEPWGVAMKRSHSDAEDEHHGEASILSNFKIPSKFGERFSTDEDEHFELPDSPVNKKFKKGHFTNPNHYVEKELTDSESDEKGSSFKSSNMPKVQTSFNGANYGVGAKLMQKMGYKAGTGLGKNLQGRVDIIEASKQRGRRGLGLHIKGLEPSDSTWDFSKEEIYVQEKVTWMPESDETPLEIKQLREWMVEDKKKENIDDETEFIDPEVLEKVLQYKSVFDHLEPEEMRKARTKSNPFETIRGGIFLNRAAMKMANMDAAFDFMFTYPVNKYGETMVGSNELLYFADICAGPGGFSEYVLWRKRWECKGFGFTLKGSNDFKLEDFYAGPPETFEPVYGVTGDGDVYVPENILDFKKFVTANTDGKGVHFVMADGGFSVEGRENEQEILSKRLYLCQFLCALSVLRTGGHFVCKLFDLFTPFSVGLVYLMYRAFDKVCIFKPNTSRPANSERYIVCKWRREDTKDICDYMYEVNCHIGKMCGAASTMDVREVVPLSVLKGDEAFFDYIVNSNNVLGARQVIHLDKIRAFAQNTDLHDGRQNDLKEQCLAFWKVPDKARLAPARPEPKVKFTELMKGEASSYLFEPSKLFLTKTSLQKLSNVFDFHCVVCGETKPDQPATLFLSIGRSNIFRYDVKNTKWSKIDVTLEIPADTLFYGELVFELKGENKGQKKIMCLHIIDAICLGGTNVRKKHFKRRMQLAEKLAKAVSKPSKPDYTPLRVKKVFELPRIEDIFERLAMKFTKSSHVPRLCFDLQDERHILPTGLLIFRTIVDPWVTAFSRTHKRTYFFDTKHNVSSYEEIEAANADFKSCFSNRLLWKWDSEVLLPEQNTKRQKNDAFHGSTVISFVKENLQRMTGTI